MNILKCVGTYLMQGAAVGLAGLLMTAAPVHSAEIAPEMLNVVDEIITKMQKETMQQQYAGMPLKADMPGMVMNSMYNNMYQYASNAYRQNIQPQMVQVIIGSMRPWDFPNKFREAMMPKMVADISSQIKNMQLQQMQEGINAPSFPQVPGMEQTGGQQQTTR